MRRAVVLSSLACAISFRHAIHRPMKTDIHCSKANLSTPLTTKSYMSNFASIFSRILSIPLIGGLGSAVFADAGNEAPIPIESFTTTQSGLRYYDLKVTSTVLLCA